MRSFLFLIATLPIEKEFQVKGGWEPVTTSIQSLFSTIVAPEVAGNVLFLVFICIAFSVMQKFGVLYLRLSENKQGSYHLISCLD